MNDAVRGIVDSLYCGLFSERDTLVEAYEHVEKLAGALRAEDRMAIYSAVHVMMNTLCQVLKEVAE